MGLGREDAQDAVQDAFIKLFRYIHRFRAGASFTNWFYRIVVHATYDHMRRDRGRERVAGEGDVRELADALPDPAPGLVEGADAAHLQRQLHAAMACLAPQERAAFVLRELHGLETAEVARAMRVTRVTVRRHVSNARRKLREHLELQFPDRSGSPEVDS